MDTLKSILDSFSKMLGSRKWVLGLAGIAVCFGNCVGWWKFANPDLYVLLTALGIPIAAEAIKDHGFKK